MARIFKWMAAAVVVALAVGAVAARQSPPNPVAAAHEAVRRGDYLEAIDRLRAAAFPLSGVGDEAAAASWLQLHPFIGSALDPAAASGEAAGALHEATVERLVRAERRDALREIAERAAATRIVILNEDHSSPRDRGFALEVARALRPLGYSLLAAETFSPSSDAAGTERLMERLAADGFPRLATGFYTLDPVFGQFVREALALGYRPVAYESTTFAGNLPPYQQVAVREQDQAENLARLLRDNPHAKILVYVGFAHAAEAPLPFDESRAIEWMAARLKRLTGVDPLTIDQTLFEETNPRHVAYRAAIAPVMGDRPVVLFEGGRPLIQRTADGAYDLQVIHPPPRLVRGRPDWLWRLGRRAASVPRALLPRRGRRLVQAFAADEPADAVPLDQIIVEAGTRPPPLLVPRGRRIRFAHQDPVPVD